ncbi:hypothetical protein [Extensimonas perlucida]|uniref:hypothetical protein n=1 Tax=Extensimonas perlucida TaxID=2590786 RepID=UPI0011A75671|nr:hypothetical protein [Extensimonas perlucida]
MEKHPPLQPGKRASTKKNVFDGNNKNIEICLGFPPIPRQTFFIIITNHRTDVQKTTRQPSSPLEHA